MIRARVSSGMLPRALLHAGISHARCMSLYGCMGKQAGRLLCTAEKGKAMRKKMMSYTFDYRQAAG